jgi:hypothetical protein
MSRHTFNTKLGEKPVRLVMGWDRPLQNFFYHVHDLSAGPSDEDILGTSWTMSPSEQRDFPLMLEKVKELGITPPQKMVDEVKADKVNNVGNRMETYD